MYRIILTIFSLLCFITGVSQPVPTSYGEAKKLGDVKYKTLQKTNAPEEVRYVVLKSGSDLERLLKYENSVYVVNKVYDLKWKFRRKVTPFFSYERDPLFRLKVIPWS